MRDWDSRSISITLAIHTRTLVHKSLQATNRTRLVQNGVVRGQQSAVLRDNNRGSSAALVGDVAVVVRRAQHLDLSNSRAILVGKVFVDARAKSVRLDLTGTRVAHRDLEELAGGDGLIGTVLTGAPTGADAVGAVALGAAAITAALNRLERHVQSPGDLPRGVAVQSVVQPRPSDQALVGAGSVDDARGPVWLADLARNDDGLANVWHHRHIDHYAKRIAVSG